MNLNQVTLPVVNMEEAANFYRRMGFTQIVDTEHYARFECPEGDSTFSLSLQSQAPANGAVIYFEHQDLDRLVRELKSRRFCAAGPSRLGPSFSDEHPQLAESSQSAAA